ncbi:MAG TPA: bifunctional methionine sulfoxide reductase B/A protein [Planctomycetota bacterium]|nr:bifunctional methionine sulfoxide reductase B/A protein [Planctomycetota bacterium]
MPTPHPATRPGARRALGLLLVLAALRVAGGCWAGDPDENAKGAAQKEPQMVTVRVFNDKGDLVGPVPSKKVVKTDEEWKRQLTEEQFRITRHADTERPFCGTLLDNKREGVYACVCCGLPLFSSSAKFHSGTGWPSFFQPIAGENVAERADKSHGMVRIEINCARCDAHLGHVFRDGPRPTGLRYCLNSESLAFTDIADVKRLADPAAEKAGALATAVFAGGCFWCVEAVFEELEGVVDATSGYAGGSKETANYKAVCTGTTGHAEAVRVTYDPKKISYVDLLKVHFATHDPTTLNRQGNDEGTQYRSAIFYANEEEKELAEAFLSDLKDGKVYKSPIVTTLEPLKEFYPAETYHQNYVCTNPGQPYVRAVALPKVEKVREKFKDKLKETSPLGK